MRKVIAQSDICVGRRRRTTPPHGSASQPARSSNGSAAATLLSMLNTCAVTAVPVDLLMMANGVSSPLPLTRSRRQAAPSRCSLGGGFTPFSGAACMQRQAQDRVSHLASPSMLP